MSGIGVILNPYSKRYKNNPNKLEQMAFIVGDKASCKSTHDLDDLTRVAEEFKSRDIDALAISGGDGTIHCTLTAFLRVYGEKPLPKITFLKGGTLNTVARTMGIHGKTEKLLSNFLVKYHEDIPFEVKKLRLLRVNNHYGCLFGIGLIYNFMDAYYNHKEVSPWVAVKTLSHTIFSALFNTPYTRKMNARFDAEVIADGQVWPYANYSAIYAGSIRQFGLDFNNFHYMIAQNQKIHACAMSCQARTILPYVWKMRQGQVSGLPDLFEQPVTNFEIKLNQPLPYMIDGELLPPTDHYVISAGPELQVLT